LFFILMVRIGRDEQMKSIRGTAMAGTLAGESHIAD